MGALGKITQPAQAEYMEAYGNMNAATFLIIGFMLNQFLQQSQFAPQRIASQSARAIHTRAIRSIVDRFLSIVYILFAEVQECTPKVTPVLL